ncbi:MAG: hypothetical protein NT040_15775 [Bacteroidetes bacterium]|nr:hypothetical protein [Bacteroidota bacterium]
MKNIPFLKIGFIVSVALAICISSCAPSAKERETSAVNDSIRVADSLAMIQAEQQRIADSIASRTMPHFPWPPPPASASVKIPRNFIVKPNENNTLFQVAREFESALTNAGYVSFSYFYVPSGFAMVSQLEQINADGTPKTDPDRWSVQYQKARVFDLKSYITALFTSRPGYFRIIVFIFTSEPFSESGYKMPKDTAAKLVHAGNSDLPPAIGNIKFSAKFNCTTKIYEFEQKSMNSAAVLQIPSLVDGKQHLVKSKIWEEIAK